MAQVRTTPSFEADLNKLIESALLDFGQATANRCYTAIDTIYRRLLLMPESYPYVMIGKRVFRQYRGANFMHNFKLIYRYDADKDEARIFKILDMRRNPNSLVREMNEIWKNRNDGAI